MREILFRAKRKDDGAWFYGNPFIPILENAETQICIGTPTVRISYDVDPKTLGQFTGLYDKNGTKIFEGDIVYTKIYQDYCDCEVVVDSHIVEFIPDRGGWYPFASGDGYRAYLVKHKRQVETRMKWDKNDPTLKPLLNDIIAKIIETLTE